MTDPTGFLTIDRHDRTTRPIAERVRDYREYVLPLRTDEVEIQATRCMDCGVPFCHTACPVGNFIPDWNGLVSDRHWQAACDRLHRTNNFPEFTGRVCDLSGVLSADFSSLTSISVVGGNGDDSILGSNEFADSLLGGDGNDTLDGQGGNDTLDGQDGGDAITGGAGIDSINGGDGADNIDAGTDNDSVNAGNGADNVTLGDGNDIGNGANAETDRETESGWDARSLVAPASWSPSEPLRERATTR